MLKRLPIRTKLLALVSIPLAVLIIAGLLGIRTLQQARVGGPRYDEIVLSKDLVADVLPPPEFLVESYLTVYQMAFDPSDESLTILTAKLAGLEKSFLDRQAYWDSRLTDSTLRETLLQQSREPGLAFFDTVNSTFLPSLRLNNAAARKLVLGPLKQNFETHRAAIEQVVILATAEQTRVEVVSNNFVSRNLAVLLATFVLGVLLTAVLGTAIARSIIRPIRQLRRAATEDLPRTVEAIRNADIESRQIPVLKPIQIDSGDELAEAATAFNAVVSTALNLASDQVKLRQHTSEMFVNLGHRNQTFINRQHELIDNIQANVVDPDMLAGLFELDHTVTRMRRNAESLLVLAGTRQSRSWSAPVAVSEVIGGAVSEVADMHRVDVTIGGSDDRFIQGSQAFDLSHLIAELVENATLYSGPTTRIDVRVQRSQNRMRIWIMDNGIGMSEAEIADANRRVSEPPGIEELSTDQVGFQVVARLARRLGVAVRLQDNPAGGLAVNVDLPPAIFAEASEPVSERPPVAAPVATRVQHRPTAAAVIINTDDFAFEDTTTAANITTEVAVIDAPQSADALPARRRSDAAPAQDTNGAAAPLPRRRAAIGEPVPTDGPRFNIFGGATDAPAATAATQSDDDAAALARRMAAFTQSVERGRADDEFDDNAPVGDA